ncbi:LexA family protein [Rubrivirga sp. IMCC43871]|uniref:LexA family protein n=1 Tax=Rubrivirga sp. IMCC43871 TaxID=3391575 RepID=UPI00398FCFAE
MSRRQLTHKQHAFLKFLREHIDDHKVWPTYREIADHFEYRSPNSVTQNLQALSRKGFLQRGRNGYALVEQGARDGSVRLRGALRSGRIEPGPSDRLSLTSLFPDFTGIHAVELAEDVSRTSELGQARYVFVGDGEVPIGETAVVMDGHRLAIGRMRDDGCIDCDYELEAPEVLGRYAGHAGPYGLVRAQAMLAAEA